MTKRVVLLVIGSAYILLLSLVTAHYMYKQESNFEQKSTKQIVVNKELKKENQKDLKQNNISALRADSKPAKKSTITKAEKPAKNMPASSYYVKGKKYYTLSTEAAKNLTQIGYASWYGPGFHGKKTANGEIYNQNAMTAAHKSLPLSTKIKVTNLENNKSVFLRVNDRGPYHGNRILDLSKKAAEQLGVLAKGTAKIKLQVLN